MTNYVTRPYVWSVYHPLNGCPPRAKQLSTIP